MTGPLWDTMDTGPEAEKQAAFAAIREALEPHRLANGSYQLVSQAYLIAGRKAQS